MTDKEAEERFWQFALAVYGQDAARVAFLRLQDKDGADVPMLLWCLWCGAEGRAVSVEAVEAALAFNEVWRAAAVLPMRDVRRALKPGVAGAPDALTEAARTRVAQAEQAIERLQMEHLVTLAEAPSLPPSRALAEQALALYGGGAGLMFDQADLEIILGHAGPITGLVADL